MYYSEVIDRILIDIYKFSFSMHLLVVFIIIILTYIFKWIAYIYANRKLKKKHIMHSLLLVYHSYLC